MKSMKRILAIVLALMFTLTALASCNSDAGPSKMPSADPSEIVDTTSSDFTIGINFYSITDSLGSAVYDNLKYSLQGTTQGRYLTGGVPPIRFSM